MALAILALYSNSTPVDADFLAVGLFAFVLAFALCVISMVNLWNVSTDAYDSIQIKRSLLLFYAKLGLLVIGVVAVALGLTGR